MLKNFHMEFVNMRKYISLLCLITVVGASRASAGAGDMSQFVVSNASHATVGDVISESQVKGIAASHLVLDAYMCQLNPYIAAKKGATADSLKADMLSYIKSLVDSGKIKRDVSEGTEYSYLVGIASDLAENGNAYANAIVAAVKSNAELAMAQAWHHVLSGFVNNPNVHDSEAKSGINGIISRLSSYISGQKSTESSSAMVALLESTKPALRFQYVPLQQKVNTGCCGRAEAAAANEVNTIEKAAKADAKVCCGCWGSSNSEPSA